MKTIKPPTPALTFLAALLVTGCSGSLWGLPVPHAPRRTPDHFRGATQMVAAAPDQPPEVPSPAGLPVVIAAWWWSRRLRDCDRP
jgi:hypothetical protein